MSALGDVSRTLKSVGPNATLVNGDLEGFARALKAEHESAIEVAGPELAGSLAALGLLDEYQLYLRPVVLGGGKPFFAGSGRRSGSCPANRSPTRSG